MENTIAQMFKEWEKEPLYKVYEVVNKRSVVLDKIVGIGGAAGFCSSYCPAVGL